MPVSQNLLHVGQLFFKFLVFYVDGGLEFGPGEEGNEGGREGGRQAGG